MAVEERTRDVYEPLAAYPRPLPVPLPEPGDLETLGELGVRFTPLSRAVTRAALRISGFDAFWRQLPEQAEDLLRKYDLRGANLCGPGIAATTVLRDDARRPGALTRAATLVAAAGSLHDDLRTGRLPPDRHHDDVLEMGKYPNLFATSLVVDDENRTPRIYKSRRTDQITVILGRRLHVLVVGDLTAETIVERLTRALEELATATARSRLPADELPVGLLTAAGHETQGALFPRLSRHQTNARSLAALRESFLTLCLDLDSHPSSDEEAAAIAHSGNPGNRWYHSSLQLVVFGNGRACVVHNSAAYLDGNIMMRAAAELQRRASARSLARADGHPAAALAPATLLLWVIDPALFGQPLQEVRAIQDCQQSTYTLPGIGTSFFARHGVAAIPAFVVALQYATQRLRTEPTTIKQMLTMSRHRCTDFRTASVSTPEVMRLVENLLDDAPAAGARRLLQEAIESQGRACRRARQAVPLPELLWLFISSRDTVSRWWASAVIGGGMKLLALLGSFRPELNEVVISHPSIYPEVGFLGRPGSRIPYVDAYTLHYQIHPEKIVVTVAPSLAWTVPNAEFIAELREGLQRVQRIIEAS
jgi:hypothetical protein